MCIDEGGNFYLKTSNAQTIELGGLKSDTRYHCRARAKNSANVGEEKEFSNLMMAIFKRQVIFKNSTKL